MKLITEEKDLIGETVDVIYNDDRGMFLKFKSGRVAKLSGGDSGCVEIERELYHRDVRRFLDLGWLK